MSQDEKELRKSIEKLETQETAIQQEIAELAGTPSEHQRLILEDLTRLQHSLRGPEDMLDKRSYSRPFPPGRAAITTRVDLRSPIKGPRGHCKQARQAN